MTSINPVFEALNLIPDGVRSFTLCATHAVLASNHARGLGLVEKCETIHPSRLSCDVDSCGLAVFVQIEFRKPIPTDNGTIGLFALPKSLTLESLNEVKAKYQELCKNGYKEGRAYLGWLLRQVEMGNVPITYDAGSLPHIKACDDAYLVYRELPGDGIAWIDEADLEDMK